MKEGDSRWVEKDAELKRDVIYFTPVHIPPSPSPTSTILPGAPPSQHCCIYYDKSFSNLFGYRELLISRICLFSLGWNDQDAKWQGHPTTVFSRMLLDAVLGYLEYF